MLCGSISHCNVREVFIPIVLMFIDKCGQPYKINCGRNGKPQVIHVDRIRKKYPQNLPGEESEQIESYEETVAKDDLPNDSSVGAWHL
jgi:hypothetical protein